MVMHRNSLSASILSLHSFFRQVKFCEEVVITRGCVGLSDFVQEYHTVFMDNMQIYFCHNSFSSIQFTVLSYFLITCIVFFCFRMQGLCLGGIMVTR